MTEGMETINIDEAYNAMTKEEKAELVEMVKPIGIYVWDAESNDWEPILGDYHLYPKEPINQIFQHDGDFWYINKRANPNVKEKQND